MKKQVLIIGGYGNFGRFISKRLAQDDALDIVVAGRSFNKAQQLANEINATPFALDIHDGFIEALAQVRPDIVIYTSGPFQQQGYSVAEACIKMGAHYIDLADGREFVVGIDRLDSAAKESDVLVVSGASSVPCLTSALLDHYQSEFSALEAVDYGITTAQKTTRGLATTAAILGYTGKPFTTLIDGCEQEVYGWQNLHARKYSELGWRLLGSCDVPDLTLFPKRYPSLKTVRFDAGLELPFVHVTLWLISWLVRAGLWRHLERAAPLLLKTSFLFDRLGTDNSGFHMKIWGMDKKQKPKKVTFELLAKQGDGPFIPCMPAILLAKKLAYGQLCQTGAQPCVGLITKDEYLNALSELHITWTER